MLREDDPAHREGNTWADRGAEEVSLAGPVDPDTFRQILEGNGLGNPQRRKRPKGGEIQRRPGRDVTLAGPKSASPEAAE